MMRYEYTEPGEVSARLRIVPAPGNGQGTGARIAIDDEGSSEYVDITPDEVPAAALALYGAAGLPMPVILPHPEHTGGIGYAGRTDRYACTSRIGAKLAIGWRGIEPVELDPDEALEFAAHIAVNAMAAKAAEPDPGLIGQLADLIEYEDLSLDFESRWSLARAILLGGWKREPGQ